MARLPVRVARAAAELLEAALYAPGWAGPPWMETGDGFGGFRKLHHFPNVALAVSKTGKMEIERVYDAPAGWHWGSRAEVAAIMGSLGFGLRDDARHEPEKMYYNGQGGWERLTWGGVKRNRFVFSDSLQGGSIIHACDLEGELCNDLTGAKLAEELPVRWFAGIVCVAD